MHANYQTHKYYINPHIRSLEDPNFICKLRQIATRMTSAQQTKLVAHTPTNVPNSLPESPTPAMFPTLSLFHWKRVFSLQTIGIDEKGKAISRITCILLLETMIGYRFLSSVFRGTISCLSRMKPCDFEFLKENNFQNPFPTIERDKQATSSN